MVDLALLKTRRVFSHTICVDTQYTISEHFLASLRFRNLLNGRREFSLIGLLETPARDT